MGFINCILYLITSGIIVLLIGRLFPRKWIREKSFPFKSYKFENEGKIYDKIKIRFWKTKLPDASLIISKISPNFMPKKRIDKIEDSNEKIKVLVKETCVAESTHFVTGLLGLLCIRIWNKLGGKLIAVIYFVWNMLFVCIQRYNRPRMLKVIERM